MKFPKKTLPDGIFTIVTLLVTFCTILFLQHLFDTRTLTPMIFVLGVFLVSWRTQGYFWGIAASLISVLAVNYAFTYPYWAFDLISPECIASAVVMLIVATMTGALTTRLKKQEKVKAEAETERMRGNLLRAVSHDLRTPLTAISGAASVLLSSEEIASSERSASLVRDIKSDADSLSAMVENLLSITKIRDGVMPLNKQEEMLEEVAGDALLTIRRRFPDYPIALELSDDILYLPMEPMLIKQVIVNLLENAIRHSGDREHIRLRLFRQEDWAVVEVRDRGRGISPEVSQAVQLGRPLEDNLSGDSSRGMGIGLSVCQSIIKAHNGFFAAGNDPEGGAVFRFGLPMEETKDE